MPRTTEELVTELLGEDLQSGDTLEPFIASAFNLVTNVCAELGYDDETLELIERWLSAHFYCVRRQKLSSKSVGRASQAYQNKVDLKLNLTAYGQQAMVLDYLGGLAEAGKMRVGATWLGTEYGGSQAED